MCVPHCVLQAGAAVYQVVPHEEEGMLTRAPADGADLTTRLVIPDDVISSNMLRWVCVHVSISCVVAYMTNVCELAIS